MSVIIGTINTEHAEISPMKIEKLELWKKAKAKLHKKLCCICEEEFNCKYRNIEK